MNIPDIYQLFLENPVISTDSRSVVPGSLFFALKGENFNGNLFALDAIDKGARYAIVDDKNVVQDEHFVLVSDVLDTLQKLANYHRKQLGLKILAITGSNGKTTTKELIYEVLSVKLKTKATQGNLNNHIGVPLTILSFDEYTKMGIVEMGANHPNEIKKLCEIAEPNYGIITNIGKAHLEGFGSLQGVQKAKGELFDFLAKSKGTIFYNASNAFVRNILPGIGKEIPYGTKPVLDTYGKIISAEPYVKIKIVAKTCMEVQKYEINTQLVGQYNLENVMAAVTIGQYFGIPDKQIKQAIENYKPQNNRSQFIKSKKNEIILDAYNANPDSMKLAIHNFLEFEKKNKMVIVGEMLELGSLTNDEHKQLYNLLKENLNNNKISKLIFVGRNFQSFCEDTDLFFNNVDQLIDWIHTNPLNHSFILIKGSRGNKLEKVIPFL
ncbi:MAG: UDP-N-acetylmuramoyl-tripeptide--D-alanyl-D-alanine ligase [Bacteroidales bacterium]|nr:UDP-N-acetylmuramoyl-tripeptide--D-alanyl-D-alanine ligase [Bacteroidales bacterium]